MKCEKRKGKNVFQFQVIQHNPNVLHWRSAGNSLLVLPGGVAEKKDDVELTEKLDGKSPARTPTAMLLLPKLLRSTLLFVNAFLAEVLLRYAENSLLYKNCVNAIGLHFLNCLIFNLGL